MTKTQEAELKPLTKKQRAFVKHYRGLGDGVNAVMKAGYNVKNVNSAKVIASENLTRLNVRAYLAMHALPAMERIEELSSTSNNSMVKLLANKDILDRAGFKPVERQITADVSPLLILPAELINREQV